MFRNFGLSVIIQFLLVTPSIGLANVCFSKPSQTLDNVPTTKSLDEFSLHYRHQLALQASKATYILSDLQNVNNGQSLIDAYAAFSRRVPLGYKPFQVSARRDTGFKYIILEPLAPDFPWILAFTGTENLIDWLSDFNLGRNQLAQAEELIELLTDCTSTDHLGIPLASKKWIVTGHSLGGGLAQAFAYRVQEDRFLRHMPGADLELVTFNAFGALDILRVTLVAGTQILTSIRAANYFLTGDPVSRVGLHVGSTLEIRLPPAQLSELPQRHSLNELERQIQFAGGFQAAVQSVPPSAKITKALKKYGYFTRRWPSFVSESLNGQLQDLNILESGMDIILRRQEREPYDHETLWYIADLAIHFSDQLKRIPDGGINHDHMIKRLNRVVVLSGIIGLQKRIHANSVNRFTTK